MWRVWGLLHGPDAILEVAAVGAAHIVNGKRPHGGAFASGAHAADVLLLGQVVPIVVRSSVESTVYNSHRRALT